MSGTVLWAAVIAGSLGCYLLKLAGLSVPAAWVEQPWVARIVDFVPAALLAALVAVQTVASGNDLVLDGRLVGLAVAALALALRAPFIVVLVLAGAAGALVARRRRLSRRRVAQNSRSAALLEVEQEPLAREPAAEADQAAVGPDHPVAGHDDGDRVAPVRGADRLGAARLAHRLGDVAVGARLAVRDAGELRPRRPARSRSRAAGAAGRTPSARPRSTRPSCRTTSSSPSSDRSPSASGSSCVGGDMASRTSSPSSWTTVSGPIGDGTTVCVLRHGATVAPGVRQCSAVGPPDLAVHDGVGGRRVRARGRPRPTRRGRGGCARVNRATPASRELGPAPRAPPPGRTPVPGGARRRPTRGRRSRPVTVAWTVPTSSPVSRRRSIQLSHASPPSGECPTT